MEALSLISKNYTWVVSSHCRPKGGAVLGYDRRNTNCKEVHKDRRGIWVSCVFSHEDHLIEVFCKYAPNETKQRVLMWNNIKPSQCVIQLGDFNMVEFS